MRDDLDFLALLRADLARFDFVQAVRLIECAAQDKPRVGESLRPRDDLVRFGQNPELVFQPTTLAALDTGNDVRPPRLAVNFFGLFGPQGALPLHLTEYARERIRNFSDFTFARFCDIFQHRFVSLFYRARAVGEPVVNLDRPKEDRFRLYVGALFGMAEKSQHDRDAVPDFAKFHFAGLLANRTRHPSGLVEILSEFFAVPVRLEEFVGHWMTLPVSDRTTLGGRGRESRLGDATVLGARVYDVQSNFRLILGPLPLEDYERLLPGGTSMQRLAAWVKTYVGYALRCEVRLVLKREEVPAVRLGRGARLGWTTWLSSRPMARDPDDLVVCPDP